MGLVDVVSMRINLRERRELITEQVKTTDREVQDAVPTVQPYFVRKEKVANDRNYITNFPITYLLYSYHNRR